MSSWDDTIRGLLGVSQTSTGHALDVCLRRETCPGLTKALLTRIAELEAEVGNRRRRASLAISTLREACKLRPDCCRVEDAAEDATALITELKAELEAERVTGADNGQGQGAVKEEPSADVGP